MKVLWLILSVLAMASPVAANPAATDALNAIRAEAGRAALSHVPALARAARTHARDMAENKFFDHRGSDGSNVGKRARRAGYEWCWAAENIAKGQSSLEAVLTAWAGSRGHARNMLHRRADAFGIARARGNIWVMVLAGPCLSGGAAAPHTIPGTHCGPEPSD